ncbi:MAG: aspartate carbamoyltransferase [Lachnospiraceae bacterium]|nr:aspartate carbamoyltransferase [Lachnospiraceae bacterium]
MKHIISCEQFDREWLERLFNLADDMMEHPENYTQSLRHKVIATMFFEPSTRTRLSFEAAIMRLGARNISTENAREASSATKGESLEDTIRVVAGYTDGIVMRHFDKDAALRAAQVSSVPIFNAGSGSGAHPTQALLDMYTIHKCNKAFNHLSVAVVGDLLFGRTVHSLIKLLAVYDHVIIYGLSSPHFALPKEYVDYLKIHNATYIPCNSFAELPENIDVIYNTRTQLERFTESDLAPKEFIVNKKVLNNFSDETILLHPLPRNAEIATDVDDDPRAMYFKQAHYGMWVRMALLHDTILNQD